MNKFMIIYNIIGFSLIITLLIKLNKERKK